MQILFILSLTGCTSLYIASINGDVKKVNSLLDNGADINEHAVDFMTPLMGAIYTKKYDVAKLLIQRGADVNAQDAKGNTALFYAINNNNTEIAEDLIKNGADVNIRYKYAEKLLHIAESNNNPRIIKMIKPTQPDKYTSKNNTEVFLIAVLDFKAKGVSRNDAVHVTEWLRTDLINTGRFKVIERSAMDAIFREQSLSMTGCTDTSCAVEVGKLLSAKKMLMGDVELWNDKIFINGRIIDVEKGVAEFAHRESINSIKELDTGTSNFAKNLSRKINGLQAE